MTSHAIAINTRSELTLFEAPAPAPARTRNMNYVVECDYDHREDTGEDFWMYLEMRATHGTINTCLTRLDAHLQAHPDADAEIVGIGTDQHTLRVIIGVNLGDSYKIKSRPKNVLAAYDFVQTLTENLANFWPQYLTGTPTDEERDLLATVVATGAITARPTIETGTDAKILAFVPNREFVTDGDGGLWQVEVAVA
ncbi:MAG: hypothetical protein ACOH1Y_17305 [Propionicimonas sp.]